MGMFGGWRSRARLGAATLMAGLALSVAPVVTAAPAAAAVAPQTRWAGPGVSGFGDASQQGGFSGMVLSAPLVGLAADPSTSGYWAAAADGGVFSFAGARFFGSLGANIHLYAPMVGMAATPDGRGYWLVALDGGVFTFGDAGFFGSIGGVTPKDPIVAMVATPDGRGYWLAGAGGEIYRFGDAVSYGSLAGTHLAAPISAMARTSDGRGYWLVGQDGGVFTFGDAPFLGSAASLNIGASVVGIAPTADGRGYWLAAATAGILTYGDAPFLGPSPNDPPFSPAAAIAPTNDGGGYWLLQPDQATVGFTNPGPQSAAFPAGAATVQQAASQLGPWPTTTPFCNPYGPCEEWCALFATAMWNRAGIPIPDYAFTGAVYNWSAAHGRVLAGNAVPVPGDGIMYGTGPQTSSTSVHMGIVAQVWPDGAVDTIEGDAGPEPNGHYGVIIGGPFLPADSQLVNGMGVYGYSQP